MKSWLSLLSLLAVYPRFKSAVTDWEPQTVYIPTAGGLAFTEQVLHSKDGLFDYTHFLLFPPPPHFSFLPPPPRGAGGRGGGGEEGDLSIGRKDRDNQLFRSNRLVQVFREG